MERTGAKSCKKRDEVVPGIELGLPESESDVLTITLYNLVVEAFSVNVYYVLSHVDSHYPDAKSTTLVSRMWYT